MGASCRGPGCTRPAPSLKVLIFVYMCIRSTGSLNRTPNLHHRRGFREEGVRRLVGIPAKYFKQTDADVCVFKRYSPSVVQSRAMGMTWRKPFIVTVTTSSPRPADSDGLAHDYRAFTTLGLVLALGHLLALCLSPYHSNLARNPVPIRGRLVFQSAYAP